MKSKTFIIAEAGVNHNGSIVLARKLIDVAKIRCRRCKISSLYN